MASSSFPLALSMWFYCLEQLCCSENCLIPEHKQAAFPTSKQCPWSPWDYSCIANTSLGAGNDGYRHFSALAAPPKSYLWISLLILEHRQPPFLHSLFVLFAPGSELRLKYLCVILLLSACPFSLNNCFWQFLNHIWKDIIWARSSWASWTASSIFFLTCVLFPPFIFNRQLGAFFLIK